MAVAAAAAQNGGTTVSALELRGVSKTYGQGEAVVHALRERGILVRSMAKKPVIAGSFRLTIGTLADMRRFVSAFEPIVASGPRSAAYSRSLR